MGLLRAHLTAVAVVVVAVAAVGAALTFARPTYRPDALPPPPNDVPFDRATYVPANTQIAFAVHGLHLTRRSDLIGTTDFSSADSRVEVTVFGTPDDVKASGGTGWDYVLDTNRHWVHYPRTCAGGVRSAALWRENVRVVVRCGDGDTILLRRAARALDALPRT